MKNLFGSAKVEKKAVVQKVKTAAEKETDSLVAHQMEMLKQQKQSSNDDQELGESSHGEMKNLFGSAKVEKKAVVQKAKSQFPSWMSQEEQADMLAAQAQQMSLLHNMGGQVKDTENVGSGEEIADAFSARFGLSAPKASQWDLGEAKTVAKKEPVQLPKVVAPVAPQVAKSTEVVMDTNFVKMSKSTAKKFEKFLANLGESNEDAPNKVAQQTPQVAVEGLGETLVDPDGTPLSPSVVKKAEGNSDAQISFDFEGR